MPSTKKRVNLTIPDNIYQQLQDYKSEYGLESDATACLQLIVRQLNAIKESKDMFAFMRNATPEQLKEITNLGLSVATQELNDLDNNNAQV